MPWPVNARCRAPPRLDDLKGVRPNTGRVLRAQLFAQTKAYMDGLTRLAEEGYMSLTRLVSEFVRQKEQRRREGAHATVRSEGAAA